MPWIIPKTCTPGLGPTAEMLHRHPDQQAEPGDRLGDGGEPKPPCGRRQLPVRVAVGAGRYSPQDPSDADRTGGEDDRSQHPPVRGDERAERTDHRNRRNRRGLRRPRHPETGSVVADHRPDSRAVEHPLLEPRARLREAPRGDDEEHRRRQPRHDDADRSDADRDPPEGEPNAACESSGHRSAGYGRHRTPFPPAFDLAWPPSGDAIPPGWRNWQTRGA